MLVVANKADNNALGEDAFEFYGLGLGTVYPVSAYHNLGNWGHAGCGRRGLRRSGPAAG